MSILFKTIAAIEGLGYCNITEVKQIKLGIVNLILTHRVHNNFLREN